MEAGSVAGFVLASVLIELTPGPNMAWLAILAAAQGRRPALAAVAGVALGLAVVGAIAALGLGAMISASPALYAALRWAGVVWLFWLAVEAWREADAPPEEVEGHWRPALYFRRGLITNLLNPKAAVFYIAVLPTFVAGTAPILVQTVTLSAIYVGVATLIHAAIVMLAGSAAVLLTDPWRTGLIRRVLAVALAGVAVWFLFKTG